MGALLLVVLKTKLAKLIHLVVFLQHQLACNSAAAYQPGSRPNCSLRQIQCNQTIRKNRRRLYEHICWLSDDDVFFVYILVFYRECNFSFDRTGSSKDIKNPIHSRQARGDLWKDHQRVAACSQGSRVASGISLAMGERISPGTAFSRKSCLCPTQQGNSAR